MQMQVRITGRGLPLTEALKDKAQQKLAQALVPLCDDPATALDVELVSESHHDKSDHFECRVHLRLPRENTVVVHEHGADLYNAIDSAEARLLEAVKSRRDRHRNHHGAQKEAARERAQIARHNLTSDEPVRGPQQWEREEAAYDRSRAHGLN